MPASTRTVTQASEIVQDTMPPDSSYDTDGEILNDSLSPFTLRKFARWIVGASKTVFGEAGRRKGSTRIQGNAVTLTGQITSSGTTVTGSSTLFLSELEDGSWIAGPLGEYREVLSRASDTSLTLVQAFSIDIASASNFARLPALSERVDAIERHINYVLNGDFDFWQRGTTFATPANLAYTADRFQVEYDGSIGAFTVDQQAFALGQTDVPDEPKYFMRWDHTGAGSGQTVKRINLKVESVRTLAGKTVQVKFYAKVGASTQAVTIGAIQNFGTGGSPSAEVVVTAKSRTLTTTWQAFTVELFIPSISGKTIGNDGNDYLNIVFNLPLNAVFAADFSHVQVYAGTSNKSFLRAGGTVHGEFVLLSRYARAYNSDVGARVNIGGVTSAAGSVEFEFIFSPPMRAAPSLVFTGGGYTSGDLSSNDFAAVAPITSISLITTDKNGVAFSGAVGAGLTAFRPASLIQVTAGKYILFDAELP